MLLDFIVESLLPDTEATVVLNAADECCDVMLEDKSLQMRNRIMIATFYIFQDEICFETYYPNDDVSPYETINLSLADPDCAVQLSNLIEKTKGNFNRVRNDLS